MYNPELYEKINAVSRRDAENFSEEYSAGIGSMSGRCIDIGSGPCDVAVDFILPKLKPNSTLVCSDISEAMVNYGKKKYGDNERLSFIQLDIETRNLPEDLVGQFDHATSFYCLHWCLDLPLAFRNIHSLLRPGGTAFLTFLAHSSGLDAYKILQAMPKYQTYMKEAHRIIPPFQHIERPRQALMTLLTERGFEVRSCSYRAMSTVFDYSDCLKKFLLAVSPFDTERLPTDLQDEYIDDLTKEFVKRELVFYKGHTKSGERCVLYRFKVFVVHLRKLSDSYIGTLKTELTNPQINSENNSCTVGKSAIA